MYLVSACMLQYQDCHEVMHHGASRAPPGEPIEQGVSTDGYNSDEEAETSGRNNRLANPT